MRRMPTDEKCMLLKKELELTQQCLQTHPKSYWVWHHRRWVLEHLPDAYAKELSLVDWMLDQDARNCNRKACASMSKHMFFFGIGVQHMECSSWVGLPQVRCAATAAPHAPAGMGLHDTQDPAKLFKLFGLALPVQAAAKGIPRYPAGRV